MKKPIRILGGVRTFKDDPSGLSCSSNLEKAELDLTLDSVALKSSLGLGQE